MNNRFHAWAFQNFPFMEETFKEIDNYHLMMQILHYLSEQLKDYRELLDQVNNLQHWFDNLDVTEEINNKLDEMAEDGTLTDLIKAYVDPIYQEYETNINNQVSSLNSNIQSFESRIDIVEDKVARLTSYAPAGVYETVDALTTANPNHDYIYIVLSDGNWYFWNSTDSQWSSGGLYQASTGYNKEFGGVNQAFTIISKTGQTSYMSSDSKYRINTYEVGAGETYHIKTSIKGSNLPIVCFFNGDTFISYSGSVTSTSAPANKDVTVTTPANTTKMVVNSYADGYCEVYGIGDSLNSKYATKTFITYGDSRTWYDGQTFGNQTLAEGVKCNGYQYYMRKNLGINTYNYGYNGNTTIQLCNRLINPTYSFIYNTYNYIILAGGVNDWLNNITIGTVQPIGSTFDTTTVAGALQKMIETIIDNNPNCRIFLTAPFTGFNNNDEYSRTYSSIRKEIANLYSIPILDLADVSRINKVNKDDYFVDDLNDVNYQLHLNNSGYEFMSNEICSFINNN